MHCRNGLIFVLINWNSAHCVVLAVLEFCRKVWICNREGFATEAWMPTKSSVSATQLPLCHLAQLRSAEFVSALILFVYFALHSDGQGLRNGVTSLKPSSATPQLSAQDSRHSPTSTTGFNRHQTSLFGFI